MRCVLGDKKKAEQLRPDKLPTILGLQQCWQAGMNAGTVVSAKTVAISKPAFIN